MVPGLFTERHSLPAEGRITHFIMDIHVTFLTLAAVDLTEINTLVFIYVKGGLGIIPM